MGSNFLKGVLKYYSIHADGHLMCQLGSIYVSKVSKVSGSV